ncbi:MAG TPA: hypothetical protein VMH61_03920 [Candidatus Acidoferrales bacterium]|nr:hypothetical protein [Candidatus Acidoferrales bacterium]
MGATDPIPPADPGEPGRAPEPTPADGAPPRRRRRRSRRTRDAEIAIRQWADERKQQAGAAPARPLRPIAWQIPALLMLALVNVLVWRSPGAPFRAQAASTHSVALAPEQGKVALLLVAQQVEAFRAHNGRLPATALELNALLPGVRYARTGSDGYELSVLAGQHVLVYRSTVPLAVFARQLQISRAFVRGDSR